MSLNNRGYLGLQIRPVGCKCKYIDKAPNLIYSSLNTAVDESNCLYSYKQYNNRILYFGKNLYREFNIYEMHKLNSSAQI